jgi:hypothetical protein
VNRCGRFSLSRQNGFGSVSWEPECDWRPQTRALPKSARGRLLETESQTLDVVLLVHASQLVSAA